MSSERIAPDAIRDLGDAVGRADLGSLAELIAPDVVWEHNIGTGSPEEGVYEGRDSVIRLFERIIETWEHMRAVPVEIRDVGGGVYLVRGNLHVKHLISETELVSPYEQHLELREGVVVRGRMTTAVQQPANGNEGRPTAESDNAALVRRIQDAFNRLDLDWVVSQLDPEIELHEWPTAPDAQTYHGHEGARQALQSWFESWQWMQVEVLDIVENDDRVLVSTHQRAKGKGSEVEVEIRSFNVYTLEGGKVVRIQLFTEREPALEAAGLSSANIAIVRQLFDAYERKDWDGLVALLHPEVELHEWPEGPDSRVYRGADGIRSSREVWADAWESIEAQPYDFIDTGERVLVPLRTTAKGRGSSVEVAMDNFGVFTIRGSKVAKIEYFTDRDDALRAAGLSREKSQEEQQEEQEAG